MKRCNPNQKPSLDVCPQQYCFSWVPPGGKADLSGKAYDSFEEAIEACDNGVVFPKGGCAAPFGPCIRGTGSPEDKDCYEPFNSNLEKSGLPELFFCKPETLDEEDQVQYKIMATELWESNA